WFPRSGDLVGGHAAEGEDVRAALAREGGEEAGWRLAAAGPVEEVVGWEEGGGRRREAALVGGVTGDRGKAGLRVDKHVEGRWLTALEVAALAEATLAVSGADGPDAWVFKVVKRAFELLD